MGRHRPKSSWAPSRARPAVLLWAVLGSLLAASAPACSIRKLAVNRLGSALAEGSSTFAADDDPELIEGALPFGLKLMESLLAESPEHAALLQAVASGFTQYAYAFVQVKAERAEEQDLEAAEALWDRAKRLFLRARDYGLRGLDAAHHGLASRLRIEPQAACRGAGVRDVPFLYWTAVSWAAAIGASKDDAELVGDLPVVEALIERALELDEGYDHGAIHAFLIDFEMGRPPASGDAAARARAHFARALELSGGELATPLVSLAESVAVADQNRREFEELLARALAIDPAARPEWRLANLVAQRRARWLLSRADHLILD